MKQAIVIGAGIAGLASAIRLAAKGFQVDLFEKNNDYGGKMGCLEDGGYRFDLGPSLLTQIGELESLFVAAGRSMSDYIHLHRLPIVTKYFFSGGKVVNAYAEREGLVKEMQEQLAEDPSRINRYLDRSSRFYEKLGKAFLDQPIHRRKTWLRTETRRALPSVKYDLLFKSLDAYHRRSFSRPETVQLFNRFATYNGSDPYRTPGMASIIPHLELNEGAYFAAGGMRSIADALYRVALELKVRFHFNRPVQHIIHHEGNAMGVVAGNRNVFAPIVVSNLDVYYTYSRLLNDPAHAGRINRKERSSSAMVFYWGVNGRFPEFDLHNLIFGSNYPLEFERLFKYRSFFEDPSIYLYISSKLDSSHAPEGKENWYVMVNAPAHYGQDWKDLRSKVRSILLRKLAALTGKDIEAAIEVEHVMDPLMWEEKTGAFRGAIYGSSSNSRGKAFLRHPNFDPTIRGLFLVGGTVHPGGGIPLSLRSARIVSNMLREAPAHTH